MKLVTIFNYPDRLNYNVMCIAWIQQAVKHCAGLPIEILKQAGELPPSVSDEAAKHQNITVVSRQKLANRFVFGGLNDKAQHNIFFKLYNLSLYDEPFVFVDADAFILASIQPLLDAAKSKPLIAVNHQNIPGHTSHLPDKFINTGVMAVSDPEIFQFDNFIQQLMEDKKLSFPGTDQSILNSYIRKIGYNPIHPDIGFEWNSCAGYTVFSNDGTARSAGLDVEHNVYINHYWDTYKPWNIDCPIYAAVKNSLCAASEEGFDHCRNDLPMPVPPRHRKIRFFLIENGLTDRTGHHYMEALSFRKLAKQLGIQTLVLSNKQVGDDIRDELDAMPLFPSKPYDAASYDPVSGPLESFFLLGNQIAFALNSLGDQGPGFDDILISTVTTQHELLGIAKWLKKRQQNHRPFLAFNFTWDNITLPGESRDKLRVNPLVTQLYRFGLKQILAQIPATRILLTTGNPVFSRVMGEILNHTVHTFPLPVCHDFDGEPVPELDGGTPVVTFLGHMHEGKRPDLIVPLIRKVWKINPDIRFLLHGNPPELAEQWRSELSDSIEAGRIYLASGDVDQETYYRLLSSSDIVFLPYNKNNYRLQTSGVFSEALALGKVTIVPNGTWMSDVLHQKDGGGITFQENSIDAYTRAVISALNSLQTLKIKAQRLAGEWKDNMGMHAFVEKILEFHRISNA